MNNYHGKNVAVSVRNRLLALARERGESFQLLLIKYGLERLLFRLSQSIHRDRFILKGAMLFMLWGNQPHRPTRDVDFLCFGDSNAASLAQIFRELCDISVEDDGLVFSADSVRVETTRDVMEYGGVRIRLYGSLAGARVPIQADIGFGDAVTPAACEFEYPTLLGDPAPHLLVYPRETVIAEKYQALISLGMVNSRMKDYFDLWVIARDFGFDGVTVSQAIDNTFLRRQTSLMEHRPPGLSPEFYESVQKRTQWNAFLKKGNLAATPPSLMEVCQMLETFLVPPTLALVQQQKFNAHWSPGGPWRM